MNDYLERLTAVLTDCCLIECKLGNGKMATVYLAQHIENIRYFGTAYQEYRDTTKMFIPFLS